jgi:hypothetical protein
VAVRSVNRVIPDLGSFRYCDDRAIRRQRGCRPSAPRAIQTAKLDPNSPAQSLIARGPHGIRFWNFDTKSATWTRAKPYGSYPPLDSTARFDRAAQTLAAVATSEDNSLEATADAHHELATVALGLADELEAALAANAAGAEGKADVLCQPWD